MIGVSTARKDPAASPPYLPLLGLKEAPFSSAIDNRFFYVDPGREQTLNMLQHLTQYSEELLLVSGPPGIGKSALLSRFVERADQHWKTCRINGRDGKEAGNLFLYIAECFGLDLTRQRPETLFDTLREHLNALHAQQVPVLVVDDAQALSDESLEIAVHLSALEGEHGKLVRVILFAEPQIKERLADKRFSGVPEPHRFELQALTETQTTEYINHRLQVAGLSAESPFTNKVLRRIHKGSGGLPGRINTLAHEFLVEHSAANRPPLLKRLSPRWLLAAGVVAALTAGGYLYRNDIAALFENSTTTAPPGVAKTAPAPLPAATTPPSEPSAAAQPILRRDQGTAPAAMALTLGGGQSLRISCSPGAQPPSLLDQVAATPIALPSAEHSVAPEAPQVSEAQTPIPSAPVEPHAATQPLPPPAAKESPAPALQVAEPKPQLPPKAQTAAPKSSASATAAPPSAAPLAVSAIQPQQAPGSWKARQFRVSGSGFTPQTRITVRWDGKSKALPADRVSFLDEGTLEFSITTGTRPARWTVVLSNAGREQASGWFEVISAAAAAAIPVHAYDGAWVRARAGDRYTLQLVAADERKAAEDFVRRWKPGAPLAIVPTRRRGHVYYVVLQGDYPSRAAAEAAMGSIHGLPTKPWPRSYAEVQALLPPPATTAPLKGVEDSAWLWARDPSHFTVQLVGANTEQAVKEFAAAASLPRPLAYFTSTRNGQPWHVLLYGDFADKAAARAAIAALPPVLSAAGPWLRSFASVHDELSPGH